MPSSKFLIFRTAFLILKVITPKKEKTPSEKTGL